MLRFGPEDGPVVILMPALLEEANRMRALSADLLRALARRGVAGLLPDLPGMGESLVATGDLDLADVQEASAALVLALRDRPVHVAAIRSGGLIEGGVAGTSRWLFAPIAGDHFVAELMRAKQIADGAKVPLKVAALSATDPPVEVTGNSLSANALRRLHAAVFGAGRVVRLDSDPRPADRKVPGPPLWRRSEPGRALALAETLADDLAEWIRAPRPATPSDAAPGALADQPAIFANAPHAGRRVATFACEGDTLVATLDEGAETTGLLIVSGGNEPRMGAHRGMAMLAARLADAGHPVFRFDRRGVGDSTGDNRGYAGSAEDIAAAVAAFRREAPHVERIVGFGNCDAATALALFGGAAGIERLVLANPWVVERAAGELPPPAAIRARYAERLCSPRAWWRLLRGGVDLRKLADGLAAIAQPRPRSDLATRFAAAVGGRDVTVVLAAGDATAIAYADAVKDPGVAAPTITIDTASHSFARPGDMAAVERAILAALEG